MTLYAKLGLHPGVLWASFDAALANISSIAVLIGVIPNLVMAQWQAVGKGDNHHGQTEKQFWVMGY